MKTIIMRMQKSPRWAAILLAAVVAIITSAVVANATQTITTPNAAFISFNLANSTNSAAITPASNRSVLVMGCVTNIGGGGHVSLQHTIGAISWVGLESASPIGSSITQGSTATVGTHIVWIDYTHVVDIKVASGSTIYVSNQNGSGQTVAGNVTLIW